jgi:hypothetical protein
MGILCVQERLRGKIYFLNFAKGLFWGPPDKTIWHFAGLSDRIPVIQKG